MEEHEKNGWKIDHWSKSVGRYDGKVYADGHWEVTTDEWEGDRTFVTTDVASGVVNLLDGAFDAAEKALEEAAKEDEPKETSDDLEEDGEELQEKIEQLEAEIEELKKRKGVGYVHRSQCYARLPCIEQVWIGDVPFRLHHVDEEVWFNPRP